MVVPTWKSLDLAHTCDCMRTNDALLALVVVVGIISCKLKVSLMLSLLAVCGRGSEGASSIQLLQLTNFHYSSRQHLLRSKRMAGVDVHEQITQNPDDGGFGVKFAIHFKKNRTSVSYTRPMNNSKMLPIPRETNHDQQ